MGCLSKIEDLVVYDKDGELVISDELTSSLYRLARDIILSYYKGATKQDKEDLIQEAVIKGFAVLKRRDYDSEVSSLRNYLYSGMRNTMSNYMYHQRKLIPVETIVAFDENINLDLKIDLGVVKAECDLMNQDRISNLLGKVLFELIDSGFELENKPEGLIIEREEDDDKKTLVEAVICQLIKKKLEYFH